jgi:hypothetical protein
VKARRGRAFDHSCSSQVRRRTCDAPWLLSLRRRCGRLHTPDPFSAGYSGSSIVPSRRRNTSRISV